MVFLPNNSYNRYNFTARNTTNFPNDKLTLDIGAQYIIQNNTNMVSQGQYYKPPYPLCIYFTRNNFDEIRLYERYDTAKNITGFWHCRIHTDLKTAQSDR